jgi:hypothetical protein
VAAGRAQESRQDVSISGIGLIEPFRASQTDVYVHSNYALGAMASYRFMLTPSAALEANYGITYKNTITYDVNPGITNVGTRTQEMSGAFVKSFVFKKWNPFIEAGPAAFIFLPIRNTSTNGMYALDVKRQTTVGAVYGAGFAREISPSFDIRCEYRGMVTPVPSFSVSQLKANKWYNIYSPTIGVAYHF